MGSRARAFPARLACERGCAGARWSGMGRRTIVEVRGPAEAAKKQAGKLQGPERCGGGSGGGGGGGGQHGQRAGEQSRQAGRPAGAGQARRGATGPWMRRRANGERVSRGGRSISAERAFPGVRCGGRRACGGEGGLVWSWCWSWAGADAGLGSASQRVRGTAAGRREKKPNIAAAVTTARIPPRPPSRPPRKQLLHGSGLWISRVVCLTALRSPRPQPGPSHTPLLTPELQQPASYQGSSSPTAAGLHRPIPIALSSRPPACTCLSTPGAPAHAHAQAHAPAPPPYTARLSAAASMRAANES